MCAQHSGLTGQLRGRPWRRVTPKRLVGQLLGGRPTPVHPQRQPRLHLFDRQPRPSQHSGLASVDAEFGEGVSWAQLCVAVDAKDNAPDSSHRAVPARCTEEGVHDVCLGEEVLPLLPAAQVGAAATEPHAAQPSMPCGGQWLLATEP